MILISADTSKEIALALRGKCDAYRAAEVTNRLLGRKSDRSGTIVTAPRNSGKTVELLRFAEEKYENGKYAVVCPNISLAENFLRMRYNMFGDTGWTPLLLTPKTLLNMRGQVKPILCDEWNDLPEETQKTILESGLFVAAVTS